MTLHTSILVVVLLFLLTHNALAERGESVMFEPTEHPITQSSPPPQSQADKCQQLIKKIEDLKGKPQRRHAAIQHYRQACSQ
jgi:Tfp pilus assembly protein PilN